MKSGINILAGAVLSVGLAGYAEAATYNVGTLGATPYVSVESVGTGYFTDRYDFIIDVPSMDAASVTNLPLKLCDIKILNIRGLSLDIFDSDDNLLLSGKHLSWLAEPGAYFARVTGLGTGISGGAYAIALAAVPLAAPVPLPSSLWLLASGMLGLVGWARRHKI